MEEGLKTVLAHVINICLVTPSWSLSLHLNVNCGEQGLERSRCSIKICCVNVWPGFQTLAWRICSQGPGALPLAPLGWGAVEDGSSQASSCIPTPKVISRRHLRQADA